MRIVFIILLFFTILNQVVGQEKDTIISQLTNLSEAEKINLLSGAINRIIFQEPNKALIYVELYSKLPLAIGDSNKICYAYSSKGLIYEMLGDYGKALEYDFMALKLAEALDNKPKIAYSLSNIGMVYFYQSKQYDKSMGYYKKALKIWITLDNIMEISGAYSNIGLAFKMLDNNDSALYYHRKALETLELLDKSDAEIDRRKALIISNIADDFLKMNQVDSVLFYKNEARILLEKNSMQYELAELYYSIGYTHNELGNNNLALEYTEKALEIARQMHLAKARVKYLFTLGELKATDGDYIGAYNLMVRHALLADSINNVETRDKLAQLQSQYDSEKQKRKIEKLEYEAGVLEYEANVQKLHEQNYIFAILGLIVFSIGVIIMVLLKKRKDKILIEQKEQIYQQEKELAKAEKEKAEIIKEELKIELLFKNKELTTHALNMMQKNKLLDDLTARIDDFRKTANSEQKGEIRKIKREISNYLRSDKDWELFKIYFEQVNEDFFDDLKKHTPDLSINDLRLCALVKLNMNIKESAVVLNVAPNTIKSARYRLRKKLDLQQNMDLYEFIQNV